MNEHIEKLAELFKEFPGIGERQAKRFVFFLLTRHPAYLRDLASMIETIKSRITQCELCFRYYEHNGTTICDICSNPKTDKTTIMVVEKDSDLEAVRRSGTYKGMYFVFGGLIPIADEKTIERTRMRELKRRIETDAQNKLIKEVILAFSLNPHGEHTDMFLKHSLTSVTDPAGITLTSLGRGLSTGSELEYSDKDTLGYALQNRK
jgi:recombination protein RecR